MGRSGQYFIFWRLVRVLIQGIRDSVLTEGGYYCFYGDGLRKEFLLHVVSRFFFLLAFASLGCFVISDKYFCLLLLLRKVLVVCLSDLLIFGPGLSFFFFFGLGTCSTCIFSRLCFFL